MTRWVEVKNSQKEITNKHEGKPIIYLEKFSGSGHLFFHIFFPWNQLDTSKCISHLWTITAGCITKTRAVPTWILQG